MVHLKRLIKITLFYQNQSKEHYTNHTKQLCISEDQLVWVKYWLNLNKLGNQVN